MEVSKWFFVILALLAIASAYPAYYVAMQFRDRTPDDKLKGRQHGPERRIIWTGEWAVLAAPIGFLVGLIWLIAFPSTYAVVVMFVSMGWGVGALLGTSEVTDDEDYEWHKASEKEKEELRKRIANRRDAED